MVKILVKTPKSIIRSKKRKFYESLLGGTCVNCLSTERLEFDHVLPEDMSFRIGSYIDSRIEVILPELQKCQLLCRPCHSEKTASDNGYSLENHGTPSMYSNRQCRCQECSEAWAKYTRKNSKKYYYNNLSKEREKRRTYSREYRRRIVNSV